MIGGNMLDSILILSDSPRRVAALSDAFGAVVDARCEVRAIPSLKQLIDAVGRSTEHQLVAIPRTGQGGDGLQVIEEIRLASHDVPIVVVAEHGDVDGAAEAIQAGANDFLVQGERLPERIATLLGKLRGLFAAMDKNRLLAERNAQLRETIQAKFEIIGQSPQVRTLIDQIHRAAQVPRPLLITGERGTGKELVARAIHFIAGSSERPIVTVNCAAFNESLLESELFGHEKGAFTSADVMRHGRFEQADGGTLFLDEIGNMPLTFQQKILRVVEYGVYTRVGGMTELKSNARIIAATNSDLQAKMREGAFLPDLYDRLAFEVIEVPPLRVRAGDIEVLSRHFLNQFEREIPAFKGNRISRSAMQELKRYRFPGNIRELKNVIERAVYRDTGDEISAGDLGLATSEALLARAGSFREKIDTLSRQLIEDAMRGANHNQAEAARQLGLSYHQFRYYHRKYILP